MTSTTMPADATAEPAPEATPEVGGAEIVQFRPRNSINQKIVYAQHLAQSGLLPTAYRKQPANVLYAIEYGEMLGLAPMAAITGIHIIEGKPTASAALMSALVRKAGHRLRISFDHASMTATSEIVRVDDPDFTFRSVWSMDRAVQSGLVEVKNGKPWARDSKGKPLPWEKYTPAMLKARSISEVCRDGAEECLMGVHYTPEELGADVDEEGIPTGVTVEQMSTTPQTDWDAEIRKCGNSRERFADLWKRAHPDTALQERIMRAAADAGVPPKEKPAAPAQPVDPAEIVDAEIVPDPQAPAEESGDGAENAGLAALKIVDLLVAARDGDEVADLLRRVETLHVTARTMNVSGVIPGPAAEMLRIDQREDRLRLADLAALVLQHVDAEAMSVNDAAAEAAAQESDHSGSAERPIGKAAA